MAGKLCTSPASLRGHLQHMRETAAGTNVHFLEQNTLEIGDVTFGATLWTDLNFFGNVPLAEIDAARDMNDYRRYTDPRSSRPQRNSIMAGAAVGSAERQEGRGHYPPRHQQAICARPLHGWAQPAGLHLGADRVCPGTPVQIMDPRAHPLGVRLPHR